MALFWVAGVVFLPFVFDVTFSINAPRKKKWNWLEINVKGKDCAERHEERKYVPLYSLAAVRHNTIRL